LDVDSRDSPELMVFDKQTKDLLIIHEWTKNEYFIYKKIGKNPKTIMSKKVRVNRFSDNIPIFDKPVRIIEAENTNIIEDQKQIENISKEKKGLVESIRGRGGYRGGRGRGGRGGIVVNVSRDEGDVCKEHVKNLHGSQSGRGRGGYRGRGGVEVNNVSRDEGDVKNLTVSQTGRGRGRGGRGGVVVNVSRDEGDVCKVQLKTPAPQPTRGRGGRGGRARGRGGKEPHNLTVSNTNTVEISSK
jgi:hypothetical protein